MFCRIWRDSCNKNGSMNLLPECDVPSDEEEESDKEIKFFVAF